MRGAAGSILPLLSLLALACGVVVSLCVLRVHSAVYDACQRCGENVCCSGERGESADESAAQAVRRLQRMEGGVPLLRLDEEEGGERESKPTSTAQQSMQRELECWHDSLRVVCALV